jgi:chromosome segregation protein
VLAAQDEIDALQARATVIAKEQTDLPGVQREAASLRTAMETALADLGTSHTPEQARDAVPAASSRAAINRLIKEHAALEAALKAAERALAGGRRESEQAAAALAGAPEPATPALLRKVIEATRAEGPLERQFAEAGNALIAADAAVAAGFSALPLWDSDLPALLACKLPLQADAERLTGDLADAVKSADRARETLAHLDVDIARHDDALADFNAGEALPTREAIAAARAQREQAWRLIRRRFEGGPAPSREEWTALPAQTLPDAFETWVDAADRLSDRRADEAERLARWLKATTELERLHRRRSEAAQELAASHLREAKDGRMAPPAQQAAGACSCSRRRTSKAR